MMRSERVLVESAIKCVEIDGIRSGFSEEKRGMGIVRDLDSFSLKRKRPPRIEIPNVLREISCPSVSEPSVSCRVDSGFAVYSLKGKKRFMEDAHRIFSFPNGDKAFFGVYDGHGGKKAADFVAENLHLKILEMLELSPDNKSREAAVREGYLQTNEEFLRQDLSSGTCCVTALIDGKVMVVSNLGDCRAVICVRGKAEALTSDHRPAREDERRRIEDKGGFVEIHGGTWRIQGSLAVSRSIGDAHLKEWVVAEPDSKVINITPDMDYLILASDGLWEKVSNQEAVDILMRCCAFSKVVQPKDCHLTRSPRSSLVKSKRVLIDANILDPKIETTSSPRDSIRVPAMRQMRVKNNHSMSKENEPAESTSDELLAACKDLADVAVERGSLDDVTVMVVDLSYYSALS